MLSLACLVACLLLRLLACFFACSLVCSLSLSLSLAFVNPLYFVYLLSYVLACSTCLLPCVFPLFLVSTFTTIDRYIEIPPASGRQVVSRIMTFPLPLYFLPGKGAPLPYIPSVDLPPGLLALHLGQPWHTSWPAFLYSFGHQVGFRRRTDGVPRSA